MINPIVKTIELPDGRTITLETGKLAKQADGSVMLRMGNTMLLATVCAAKDAVPGTDFMPLQVEYKEKFSAFGRFPGGFTKREGRASDYEILTCRLVDRALRPLFPDNFHAEVYVNIILFSADGVDMPDALDFLAADVFELLPRLCEERAKYDLVILDPPAFTKSRRTIHSAERGYREINYRAMRLLPRGGYLATCSCSHFMESENFEYMLKNAAKDANVRLREVEVRKQAPDHPILWNVPETSYLKFYIFQIV